MAITKSKLRLERRDQPNETAQIGPVLLAPLVDEDYWEYRVVVGEHQAIVGFPKFNTIGVGFAVEDYDWNTNLPFTCGPDVIFKHIHKNKGDERIPDAVCIEAIRLICEACTADRQGGRT